MFLERWELMRGVGFNQCCHSNVNFVNINDVYSGKVDLSNQKPFGGG